MSLWIKGKISDPTGSFDPYLFSILQKNTEVIKIHQGKTKTQQQKKLLQLSLRTVTGLKVIRVCLFTGSESDSQQLPQITLRGDINRLWFAVGGQQTQITSF